MSQAGPTIEWPCLVVHAYALVGSRDERGRAWIERLRSSVTGDAAWARIGPDRSLTTFEREHVDELGGGVYQALFRTLHDTQVASLLLAPGPSSTATWSDLDAAWRTWVDAPEGLLGLACCWSGVTRSPVDVSLAAALVADRCGPSATIRSDPVAISSVVRVWDAEADPNDERRRDVFAIDRWTSSQVPADDQEMPEALEVTWSDGTAVTTPLTRLLAAELKVRHLMAQVRDEQHQLAEEHRSLQVVTEGALEALASQPEASTPEASADPAAPASTDDLAPLSRLLHDVVQGRAAVASNRSRLDHYATTVSLAIANLRDDQLVGGDPSAPALAEDIPIAEAFLQRLEDRARYASHALDASAEVPALIEQVHSQRRLELDDARLRAETALEERRRAREAAAGRTRVLEATVIGAAVMCLTAIQALGYEVPLASALVPSTIALLTAATLALGLLVALRVTTLADERGHAAPGQGRRALRWLSMGAMLVVAACGGWFAATLLGVARDPDEVPGATACWLTAVGAAIVVAATTLPKRIADAAQTPRM